MDWKALGKTLAGAGLPLLANAIPGGGVIASLISSALGLAQDAKPDDIAKALSPENVLKLRELEAKHEEVLVKAGYDYEVAMRQADKDDVAAVNTTMQSEAKAEHWLQWSWRPLNGYVLALGSLALVLGTIYLCVIAVLGKDLGVLNAIPTVVMAVTTALAVPGAVCGVTAWHRGIAQRIDAGEERAVGKVVKTT